MVFQFLSLELMVVAAVIMVYSKFRKPIILQKFISGLTIYLPPSKDDFDGLQEWLKPATPKENSKGKRNKHRDRAE